ncbi:unnamed protein product [Urochloa humidicola]
MDTTKANVDGASFGSPHDGPTLHDCSMFGIKNLQATIASASHRILNWEHELGYTILALRQPSDKLGDIKAEVDIVVSCVFDFCFIDFYVIYIPEMNLSV